MRRTFITLICSVWLFLSLSAHAIKSCGTITVADTQTPPSTLLAHIDQYILTHAFNCRVTLIKGKTKSIINCMTGTGQPDLAPAIWLRSVKEEVEKAQKEHRLFPINEAIAGGGEEGFWVPGYLVRDNDSLATLAGVKENIGLFRIPDNPARPLLYGCRLDWDCDDTVTYLFNTLGLQAAGFELFNPGTPEGFDQAIDQAYNKELPWIGYYHAPSTIMARFRMIKVDPGSPPLSEAETKACIKGSQCQDVEKSLYPVSKIQTIISQDFAYRAIPVQNYLRQRQLNRQQLNSMLVWMYEKKASPDEAARHFLVEYETVWRSWLSFYEIGKVRRSLNAP